MILPLCSQFDQGGLMLAVPQLYEDNKTHLAFVNQIVDVAKIIGSKVNMTELADDVWNLEIQLSKVNYF